MTDLVSFSKSILNNLSEDNGWLCLNNRTKINGNKMFPNRKACGKIDLFPTRDYYLFNPIYTSDGLSDNWSYHITYPYVNYYDNILITDSNGINGIPIVSGLTSSYNNSVYVILTTPYRHNLNSGDVIKLKGVDRDDSKTYTIYDTGDLNGDNKEYIFMIDGGKYTDILYDDNILNYRIVKVINKIDSSYYIRKFRKLPNFSDEEIITPDNVDEKTLTASTEYAKELYKPGFSKSIYNDSITQIQYIDDINIKYLKDNLGRPLTELFFTIVKKNKYDGDNEPSNIFGEVTSGVDSLPGITGYSNIRIITGSTYGEIPIETKISSTGSTINGVNYNNEFLGDIIEYNTTTVKEKKLDNIYHRFNTSKREEPCDLVYSDLFGDNTNMLLNSGFDEYTGGTTNITKYWNSLGMVQTENINSYSFLSSRALKITTSQYNEISGVYNSNNNELSFIKGNIYSVSFSISGTSNFNLNKVGISGMTNDFNFPVTTSLIRTGFTFTATDSGEHAIKFFTSETGKTFLIKEVKIENSPTYSDWNANPNDVNGIFRFSNKTLHLKAAKEGYFYQPNYPIKLKNYSEIIQQGEIPELNICGGFEYGFNYNNNIVSLNGQNDSVIKSIIVKLDSIEGYRNFDSIRITNNSTGKYINVKINIITYLKNSISIPYDSNFMSGISTINPNNYTFRKYSSNTIPEYAQDQYNGICLWRDILKAGVFDKESTMTNDLTFTNGRLYVTSLFNVFLRRQDPFGYYGIRVNTFPTDLYGNEISEEINNNIVKKSDSVC